MVRDESYAYSIDEKIRAYTYAVVFYFRVRMHRRNAVRALGSARLTCIHEYRICRNRSPRLVVERCRRSGHVLEEIRSAAAAARVAAVTARFRLFAESEFLFC